MRRTFVLLGILTVLGMASSLTVHSECLPNECCIEKDCCTSKKSCTEQQGCTCTFECSPVRSYCNCECGSSEPGILPPNLNHASTLQARSGIRVTNAMVSLRRVAILLQNMTEWVVQVESGITDLQAAPNYEGTLDGLFGTVAEAYGVEVVVNDDTKSVLFRTIQP